MGYYSTLMNAGLVTENKKRIKFFNEVAEELENGYDLTNSKYKEFYEKLAEKYLEAAEISSNEKTPFQVLQEDDVRLYFFYRLDEEGYLDLEDSTAKHYAIDLLAALLAYVADRKIILKFIGEDFENWQYVIDPVNHTATYYGYWSKEPQDNVIALAIETGGNFVPRTTPDVFLDVLKVKTFESQKRAKQWIKENEEKAKKQKHNLFYKIIVKE